MRITWVTRSFLDYRIPVYKTLDDLCGHELTVIYNREVESPELIQKITSVLHERAIGLTGEWRIGGKKKENAQFANTGIRIPIQPGLLKCLKRSRPEVMLSDGFMQWTYAPLLFRLFHKVPHVMCYERTPYTERRCQGYRKLYRKAALRYIDHLCANGSLCGEYLRSLGVAEQDISYGQMAADTSGMAAQVDAIPEKEQAALRQNYPCSGPLFLYTGQIIPRKGVRQLLTAWRNLASPTAGLILLGDGEERRELEAWCRQNRLNNVFWVGKRPYDEVARFYRLADVFIIPTLEDNWSLVVPEAMACGLPVACSIYNGCHPELVHAENGWTFDPTDIKETADTLRKIIATEKETLQRMGEYSKKIVSLHTPARAAAPIFNACRTAVHHCAASSCEIRRGG